MRNMDSKVNKILLISGAVLTVLQLITSVILMNELRLMDILPMDYMILGGVLVFLCVAITAITQRWKVLGIVTKVLALLMSIVFIVGSVYINITYSALNRVSGVDSKTTTINIYVLKDNTAETVADLDNSSFGLMKTIDREYTDEYIEKIEKETKISISIVEYDSILDLAGSLYDGTVEAIFMNASSVGVLTEMEEFADFESRTRVLSSHEKQEKIDSGKNDNIDNLVHSEDGHVLALYVSGVDVEGSPAENRNSDVNILCFINKKTHQILLLNTPRDYYLTVQWNGGVPDKLTHAGCKGVDCSVDTLEAFYGVKVDGYVKVNFSGFRQIIDSLGGVNVYSAYEFTSYHGNYYFSQGMNTMNGDQALCFCRERYAFGTGDNQRGRNQMEVVKAVIQKMESSDMLLNYNSVLDSVSSSMITSLTYKEISELVQYQVSEMPNWEIQTYAVTGHGGEDWCTTQGYSNYVMYPNEDSVAQAIQYIEEMYADEVIVVQ